jgi:histone H3/H4
MSNFPVKAVREYMKAYGIEIKNEDVMSKLADHIEIVIYNITGIAMAIALVNNKKSIEAPHLTHVKSYITMSCDSRKQKGGTSMPSEYFGYSHPNYNSMNTSSHAISEVNFEQGIIREAMGPSQAGGGKLNKLACEKQVKKAIKEILQHHEVNIKKEAINELNTIIHIHLECLAADLLRHSPLTMKNMDKVMKLKRHAVFH